MRELAERGVLRGAPGASAVTIRADRYEPLQIAPELAGVHSVVFDELKPMPPAGYKDVITGPARRATAAGRRLTIEHPLVATVAGQDLDCDGEGHFGSCGRSPRTG